MKQAIPHAAAGAIVLGYAWVVSRTGLAATGVQFISPVLVLMACHLAFAAMRRDLGPGYATRVSGQALVTALCLLVVLFGGTVLLPQPAQANAGETITAVLGVVFCAAVILLVCAIVVLVLYVVFRLLKALFGGPPEDDDSTLRDLGSLVVVSAGLVLASLEGVPGGYDWQTQGQAQARVQIAAPPDAVWQVMQTATSPEFALPLILQSFPQPVAVTRDEGTTLGARRTVAFAGREGAGELQLEVIAASPRHAVFAILSDSTPYAGWIRHRTLTYALEPKGTGTQLTVTLDYDRGLAPKWVFAPLMRGAARLGMDVLARDVKARSEV